MSLLQGRLSRSPVPYSPQVKYYEAHCGLEAHLCSGRPWLTRSQRAGEDWLVSPLCASQQALAPFPCLPPSPRASPRLVSTPPGPLGVACRVLGRRRGMGRSLWKLCMLSRVGHPVRLYNFPPGFSDARPVTLSMLAPPRPSEGSNPYLSPNCPRPLCL